MSVCDAYRTSIVHKERVLITVASGRGAMRHGFLSDFFYIFFSRDEREWFRYHCADNKQGRIYALMAASAIGQRATSEPYENSQ